MAPGAGAHRLRGRRDRRRNSRRAASAPPPPLPPHLTLPLAALMLAVAALSAAAELDGAAGIGGVSWGDKVALLSTPKVVCPSSPACPPCPPCPAAPKCSCGGGAEEEDDEEDDGGGDDAAPAAAVTAGSPVTIIIDATGDEDATFTVAGRRRLRGALSGAPAAPAAVRVCPQPPACRACKACAPVPDCVCEEAAAGGHKGKPLKVDFTVTMDRAPKAGGGGLWKGFKG